ncbi:MAG: GumC family protein [Stenomitos frigidus ULC029]
MNEFPQLSQFAPLSAADRGRGLRYLAIAAALNAAVWGLALYLLQGSPRLYTSLYSIVLSEQSSRTQGTLPQTMATLDRAEASIARRENAKASYELIATTDEVRRAAAERLGMTTTRFGVPQVEGVQGTALINVGIAGSTPEEAKKKAQALYEAFQERLSQLRLQQSAELDTGFEGSLGVVRKKLETAQLRLSDYKIRAGLASKEQIDQLAYTIEALRRLRSEAIAQQRDATARSQQLAGSFKISSNLATEAFALRADPLFQAFLREYSEATTQLAAVASKFGPNHPVVVQATTRQTTAESALQSRGELLLGHPTDLATIARLNTGSNAQETNPRETLFKDIVTHQVEQRGLTARVQELDRQLAQLEQRLSVLSQRSSTLEALDRDVQIAQSVFTSTLAGLQVDKGDIFGTYPLTQIVAEPNLPTAATIPRRKPLFIAATILSLLITTGCLIAWLRQTSIKWRWVAGSKH